MTTIRARQRHQLNTLTLPAEFYARPNWWREAWLQHFLDCPHVIRPGLTITVHNQYDDPSISSSPYTHVVIAVYGDYVWLRSGWRPWVMKKSRFLHDWYDAHTTCYDVIELTAEEAGEIAFGKPFLDAGDPGGIWAAHFDLALDMVESVTLPPEPLPSVADMPAGRLQTVEDSMGKWVTKFVIEEGD